MKVEPITIINVDGVPHAVADMSQQVKALVEFYDQWRQDEAEAKSELLKVQAGMRDLSREIVLTIKAEQEQADAEAAHNAAAAQAAADLEAREKADEGVLNPDEAV